MKKILCGTAAAIAMVAVAAPAAAQTSERHYTNNSGSFTFENPSTDPNFIQIGPFTIGPLPSDQEAADFLAENTELGTRYTAQASAPGNTEEATRTVSVRFRLSGRVQKDCSFYAGNNNDATDIDFGVIGVRTGNNENVNRAFEMVGPATASIETLTAGCNFNNVVEIQKDSARGLVNRRAGGFDTAQFQNNIPYSVEASWTGVARGTRDIGGDQTLAVSDTQRVGRLQQGAWRSAMNIEISAQPVDKGLVAGNYRGQTRLTLRAL